MNSMQIAENGNFLRQVIPIITAKMDDKRPSVNANGAAITTA